MSRNRIQLPTIFLGGLLAIIMEQVIQLIFFVPVQNYVQDKAQFYQEKLAGGKEISWFAENYVVNGALSNILILLALIAFAAAFYFFVVRRKNCEDCVGEACEAKVSEPAKTANVVATKTTVKSAPVKKPVAKKAPAKKTSSKKTTKK